MTRRVLLFLLTTMAFIGSLSAVSATINDRDETLRGYVNPTETLDLPFRVPRPGVNVDLTSLSSAEFEQIRSFDIHWIHHEFAVTTEWETLDQLIARIEPPQKLVAQLPTDIAFFGTFAERYAERVDFYEITSSPQMTIANYAALLNDAYTILQMYDPQSTLIASSLPDSASLQQLYAHEEAHFDAIGITTSNPYDLVPLREIMIENGDATKPIWITNLTIEDPNTITSIYTNIENEWAWVGGILLGWEADSPVWNDLTTSAYATHGLYPAQTPHAQYSGVWTFSDDGGDLGWVNDSRLRFQFTGSEIALIVREGDYVANLYPTVNNSDSTLPPRDVDGNTFILLTSDSLEPELTLIPVATDLENGTHTLDIIADELIPDETEPRWHLVGYAVSAGNIIAPYNQQITIARITTGIAFLTMMASGANLILTNPSIKRTTLTIARFGIYVVTRPALLLDKLLATVITLIRLPPQENFRFGIAFLFTGLIYFQPNIFIIAIAILGLFLLVYDLNERGLLLVIFWSPFFSFPIAVMGFTFPIAEIVLLVTLGAWGAKILGNYGKLLTQGTDATTYPKFPTKLHSLDYLLVIWVVLGGISLLWAEYTRLAITELRTLIIQPTLFYVIFRTLPINEKRLLRFIDTLILTGFAVAAIGLFQFALGESIITAEEGARRLASVYGSPNNVGLFLGRCIPFALVFVLLKFDPRRRLLSGFALGVMFIAALLTQSSGTLFIGIPVTLVIVFALAYQRRAILPIIGLGLITIAGFIFALQFPRFSNLLDFSQGTDFYRLRVWDSAINIIVDYPITGIGLDQFLYAFRGEYIMPDAWEEPTLSHPHNFILDFWTRLGLLGTIWFVGIQIVFWHITRQNYIRLFHRNQIRLGLLIGVAGSMANLLAHGLIDNSVFVLDLVYVFVLLLGLAMNISAIDEPIEEVV